MPSTKPRGPDTAWRDHGSHSRCLKHGDNHPMGVTLDLRVIDHERIAARGLQAVNDAIRDGDPAILREYLIGLPVDVDSSLVDYHTERLSRLRDVKAPEMIIRNEEQFLRLANG